MEVEDEVAEPRTTSGPGGAYSLAIAGARPFVLIAEHPGLAPVACSPVFAGERRDLVLSSGSTLTVQVHGGTERGRTPCAGAEVNVYVDAPEKTGELWASSGVTDASGRATFQGLPQGAVQVEARSGSRLGQATTASEDALPVQCEIELLATGRIYGRVIAQESGRPLAGAFVELEDFETVETDERGRFTLEGYARDGALRRLGARAPRLAPRFELLKLTAERSERTVDFALERALRASGHVVDRAGRSLAEAYVRFVGSVPLEPITSAYDRVGYETDARGRFTAELCRGVPYRVLVRAPGHGLGLFACGPVPASPAPLDLGELVLAPAASLAGRITEVPVPEKPCLVRLRWLDDDPSSKLPEHLGHLETTRADSRRRFAFDDLAPGRYRLELVQPDTPEYVGYRGASAQAAVELAPGEACRDVELGVVPFVEGTVRSESGRRLTLCKVKLFALDAPERVVVSVTTDNTGQFRLHPLADGPFRLLVEDGRLLHESRSVEPVVPGDVLELELAEFHSPLAIRGVVISESGELPEKLIISVLDSRTGERCARSIMVEADGTFTMTNLRDMPYDVELLDFENRFESLRIAGVQPGGEPVEMRIVPRH